MDSRNAIESRRSGCSYDRPQPLHCRRSPEPGLGSNGDSRLFRVLPQTATSISDRTESGKRPANAPPPLSVMYSSCVARVAAT